MGPGDLHIFSLKKGAIIKIIYGCNHKCSFCHEKDNIASLDFRSLKIENLQDIYTWIHSNGFDYIILSGGEPTLHPHLVDFIVFFQEKGIYVVVVNNGTHLHKHDFSKVNKDKITFYISYHGQKEYYNDITGSHDFDIVTKNIKMLAERFPEVILRCVLNYKNLESIEDFTLEALSLSPSVYLEFILPEDLKYEHVNKVSIPLKEYHVLVLKYLKNKRILFDGGAGCFHPKIFEILETRFDPLVNTMIGRVKKDKTGLLFNIKTQDSEHNIKSFWKKCSQCKKKSFCHGFDILYLQKFSKNIPIEDGKV
ncbi:MAG: hypothetical protein HHAS10_09710 [Candidatus Altimarinota bacterium]